MATKKGWFKKKERNHANDQELDREKKPVSRKKKVRNNNLDDTIYQEEKVLRSYFLF